MPLSINSNSRKAARVWLKTVRGCFSCAPLLQRSEAEPRRRSLDSTTSLPIHQPQLEELLTNLQKLNKTRGSSPHANLLIYPRNPCGEILTSSTWVTGHGLGLMSATVIPVGYMIKIYWRGGANESPLCTESPEKHPKKKSLVHVKLQGQRVAQWWINPPYLHIKIPLMNESI